MPCHLRFPIFINFSPCVVKDVRERALPYKLYVPVYLVAAGSVINCVVAMTCQAGNVRSLMLKQS